MPTPENAIFICYRRKDANEAAYGLYLRLKSAFGEKVVFLDHHGYEAGGTWREEAKAILSTAKVVLVIIHDRWLDLAKERFHKPNDPVREELEIALSRDPRPEIIPVTIGGQPFHDGLHDELEGASDPAFHAKLKPLFDITATNVNFDRTYHESVNALVNVIARVPGIIRLGQDTAFEIDGLSVTRRWPTPPPPRGMRNPLSPTWILQAQYRSIELQGREDLLRRLNAWLERDVRADLPEVTCDITALLLKGRAGRGKTRLALELLWEAYRDRAEHWDAGLVSGAALARVQDWDTWTWERPTLLVIDYVVAYQEPVRALLSALTARLFSASLPALRVLLLEREASLEAGWFKDLLDHQSGGSWPVRTLFGDEPLIEVEALEGLDMKRAILQGTLDHIARYEGQPPLSLPPAGTDSALDRQLSGQVTGAPDSARWDDPLYLMMAALAAHLSGRGEEALREFLTFNHIDLAGEVVRHELHRIDSFAAHEPARAKYYRRLAAIATLSKGLTMSEALQVVREENLGDPESMAQALHLAYPAPDQAIAPLDPDLIAERLVLDVLPKDLSQDLQTAILIRAVGRGDKYSAVISRLLQAFQNFNANPGHIKLLAGWLTAIADSDTSEDLTWLEVVHDKLPHQTTALRELACHVTEKLYRVAKLRFLKSPEEKEGIRLAVLANNLSIRYSDIGRREDALDASRQAVDIRRQLRKSRPEDFGPELAAALNNLSNQFGDLGRPEEALDAVLDAVNIFKQLAQTQPEIFRPDLARSLTNLSVRHSNLGQHEEALDAIREAVDILQQLAQAWPHAFKPDLARSLSNLSTCYGDLGQREEALIASIEAVDTFKQLAQIRPEAFRPELAGLLNNLSVQFSNLGRHEEALYASLESVNIRRQLAQAQPEAFRPDLAKSLNNISVQYSNLGRREEALIACIEAVDTFKQLAHGRPDAFSPDLAMSLNSLSNRLILLGRREEALIANIEAVNTFKQLVQARPEAFRPDLAITLTNLSNRLVLLERNEEALVAIREAVDIRRQLAQVRPEAFEPGLAKSLFVLGNIHKSVGRVTEAHNVQVEAIETLLEPFLRYPQSFVGLMTAICNDYVQLCQILGEELDESLIGPIVEVLERLQGEGQQSES
jgi:tetratricopeptide (TPR) repeat protein